MSGRLGKHIAVVIHACIDLQIGELGDIHRYGIRELKEAALI